MSSGCVAANLLLLALGVDFAAGPANNSLYLHVWCLPLTVSSVGVYHEQFRPETVVLASYLLGHRHCHRKGLETPGLASCLSRFESSLDADEAEMRTASDSSPAVFVLFGVVAPEPSMHRPGTKQPQRRSCRTVP